MTTSRVTITGTHAAGDIWMYGFHVGHADVSRESIADAVIPLVTNLHTSNLFTADVVARGIKVQDYNEAGTEIVASYEDSYTAAGTNASWASLPPQVAVAVTLDTPLATRKGRLYLPATASQWVAAGGRFGGGKPIVVAEWFQDIVQALDAISVTTGVKQSGGATLNVLNRVRVGDVYDVQRRRRNRVGETYASVVL